MGVPAAADHGAGWLFLAERGVVNERFDDLRETFDRKAGDRSLIITTTRPVILQNSPTVLLDRDASMPLFVKKERRDGRQGGGPGHGR